MSDTGAVVECGAGRGAGEAPDSSSRANIAGGANGSAAVAVHAHASADDTSVASSTSSGDAAADETSAASPTSSGDVAVDETSAASPALSGDVTAGEMAPTVCVPGDDASTADDSHATTCASAAAGDHAAASEAGATSRDVFVVSKEGDKFRVAVGVISLSGLVKVALGEEGTCAESPDDDDDAPEMPLPNVSSKILSKTLEFLNHHASEPMAEMEKPLQSIIMSEVVQPFYAQYVDGLDMDTLYELVLAANYMDIVPLLELTCAKIASMIKGKTPAQIRELFNIKNEFTPEEEAAINAEHQWCDEDC